MPPVANSLETVTFAQLSPLCWTTGAIPEQLAAQVRTAPNGDSGGFKTSRRAEVVSQPLGGPPSFPGLTGDARS